MKRTTIIRPSEPKFGNYVVTANPVEKLSDLAYINKDGLDLYDYQLNSSNRPNMDPVTRDLDRAQPPSREAGVIKTGMAFERIQLINDLTKMLPEMNKTYKAGVTEQDIQNLKYIPNSRFAYYNRLIKQSLGGAIKTTPDDVQLVNSVWMNPEARASLIKVLMVNHNAEAEGYSIKPIFGRGPPLKGISGNKLVLANPGTIAWNENETLTNNTSVKQITPEQKAEDMANKILHLQSFINELKARIDHEQDDITDAPVNYRIKNMVDTMRQIVSKKHVDCDTLLELSKNLKTAADSHQAAYLSSIIDPFQNRFSKIPTEIPIPSTSFSVRSNLNLTTNAGGMCAFAWNPFHITPSANSTFGINNNVALVGTASSNFFVTQAVGQQIPANLYSRYRLVSASIKLTFTSSLLTTSGFATLGVDFVDISQVVIPGNLLEAAKYGDFNLIENTYFKQSVPTRSGEVLQCNYVPLDNSFQDYYTLTNAKPGFAFVGYISGAPSTTTVARVDIVYNVEGVVDTQFTDYLPCQTYTAPYEDAKLALTLSGSVNVLTPQALSDALVRLMPNKLSKQIAIPYHNQQKETYQKMLSALIKSRDRLISNLLADERPSARKEIHDLVIDILEPKQMMDDNYTVDF